MSNFNTTSNSNTITFSYSSTITVGITYYYYYQITITIVLPNLFEKCLNDVIQETEIHVTLSIMLYSDHLKLIKILQQNIFSNIKGELK